MWGSYLSSVCRVCLNENAKNPTKFESVVFFNGPDDDSKNYLSVRECFRDCTTIEVNECDVQDTFLCSICLSRLQEAYQFQMDSRAANENFNENSARFQKFKIKDYINLSTSVTFDNPVELETNGELPQKLIQDPLVAISSKLISTTKRMEIESASNLSNDFLMTDQENDPFIKQEDIISACNRESNQESSSSSSSNSSRSRKYQKLSKEPFKNSKIVKSLEELSCENCNKKFTYKNALKYHVKHLPCLKTKFKYDEAIDKLIRKKKESIPQSSEVFDEKSQTIKSSCPECPRLFATPSTYKIHYTYQHLKIEEHENVGESSMTKIESADVDEEFLEDGIPACKRVLCKKTQKIKMQCKICKKLLGAYSAYKLHYINKHLLTKISEKKNETTEQFSEGEHLYEEIVFDYPEEIKWRHKSYRCLKCNNDETLKGELNMIKHFKQVHRIDRIYNCFKCSKRFKTIFQLNMHLSLPICPAYGDGKRRPNIEGSDIQAEKWREFTVEAVCEDCKICSSAVSYRTHMMEVHNVDRGFRCDMCDHRSKAVDSLFNHMLVHDKTAKFQCEQCGHSLRSSKALKFHVLSAHKTEGKLLCAHCPNTFVSKYLIDSHIKIKHLGIKPATCKLCQVEFGTGGACRDHVAASHLKFLVSCQLCGIKVGTKLRLKYHYGKIHKNDPRYKEVIEEYRKIKMPDVEQYVQYNVKFFDKN